MLSIKATTVKKMHEFEKIIGYTFKNKKLLERALTHTSYVNECKDKSRGHNERLEFLGDSVLSVVIAEELFLRFPKLPEGELTRIRASLVCEKMLYILAKEINLGSFLYMGKGEDATGGRNRPSVLSDAYEAVIAAVFLDGGMEEAKKYILSKMKQKIDEHGPERPVDYKSELQEIVQQNPEERVTYVLTKESGPDHDKLFTMEVHLNSNCIGEGTASSKKQAEQLAAKQALTLMGRNKD